nr:MAG TPA: hypothetical protein [Caudoviricetes sp.]
MGGRSCQRERLGMCLANPLTDQIGRRFFTDKFTLNNVCYVVNLQLVHSFPPIYMVDFSHLWGALFRRGCLRRTV